MHNRGSASLRDAAAALPDPRQGARRHTMRIGGRDPRTLLAVIAEVIAGGEADLRDLNLRSLSLRSVGDRSEACLHLAGLAEDRVRGLGDRLAREDGVDAVSVEHHWGRS